MGCVIVCKLYKGEPFLPVILLVVDEHLKELFDTLVHVFSLGIGLGVVGSGRVLGNAKKLE